MDIARAVFSRAVGLSKATEIYGRTPSGLKQGKVKAKIWFAKTFKVDLTQVRSSSRGPIVGLHDLADRKLSTADSRNALQKFTDVCPEATRQWDALNKLTDCQLLNTYRNLKRNEGALSEGFIDFEQYALAIGVTKQITKLLNARGIAAKPMSVLRAPVPDKLAFAQAVASRVRVTSGKGQPDPTQTLDVVKGNLSAFLDPKVWGAPGVVSVSEWLGFATALAALETLKDKIDKGGRIESADLDLIKSTRRTTGEKPFDGEFTTRFADVNTKDSPQTNWVKLARIVVEYYLTKQDWPKDSTYAFVDDSGPTALVNGPPQGSAIGAGDAYYDELHRKLQVVFDKAAPAAGDVEKVLENLKTTFAESLFSSDLTRERLFRPLMEAGTPTSADPVMMLKV